MDGMPAARMARSLTLSKGYHHVNEWAGWHEILAYQGDGAQFRTTGRRNTTMATTQRYQPAEQVRDGITVYRIVDTATGDIYQEYWYWSDHRDAVMDYLNDDTNPSRGGRDGDE
jgi:hypothetical protein